MTIHDKLLFAYWATAALYTLLLIVGVALKALPPIKDGTDLFFLVLVGLSFPFSILFIFMFTVEIRDDLVLRWKRWRLLRKTPPG